MVDRLVPHVGGTAVVVDPVQFSGLKKSETAVDETAQGLKPLQGTLAPDSASRGMVQIMGGTPIRKGIAGPPVTSPGAKTVTAQNVYRLYTSVPVTTVGKPLVHEVCQFIGIYHVLTGAWAFGRVMADIGHIDLLFDPAQEKSL